MRHLTLPFQDSLADLLCFHNCGVGSKDFYCVRLGERCVYDMELITALQKVIQANQVSASHAGLFCGFPIQTDRQFMCRGCISCVMLEGWEEGWFQ